MSKLSRAELKTLQDKAKTSQLDDFEKIQLTAHFTADAMRDNEDKKKPFTLVTFAIGTAATLKDAVVNGVDKVKERGEMARLERHEKSKNELKKDLACLKVDLDAGAITKQEYEKEKAEIEEILESLES